MTAKTIRPSGRSGADIPEHVLIRFAKRYAQWLEAPRDQETPASIPEAVADTESCSAVDVAQVVEDEGIAPTPASVPVANADMPTAPQCEEPPIASAPHAPSHWHRFTSNNARAAARFEKAAIKLGSPSADALYAAFDEIPPDILSWLGGERGAISSGSRADDSR